MIIQIESPTAVLGQSRGDLRNLAAAWGYEIADAPAAAEPDEPPGKGIDPVALTSLIVSLPSAALAAADLADRIRKRRRAAELIDHAREQAARQVTINVIIADRVIQVAGLTPDQLLDLQADDDSAI